MGKRREAVFPKVDAASPRGLRQPPGLTALGCQGSACDRLRLTGRLRAPPSGVMKYRSAGKVGALWDASINAAFGGENHTTGLRPSENHTTALRAKVGP